jgi:excisionase family DNA binding protein
MIMTEEKSRADEMLSATQAGRILGVSGKTVVRMMEAGDFPGFKIGFVWKFRRGDVERYLESRRYRPDQENEEN